MDFWSKKNVLIAGGTGMFGIQVSKLLYERGANIRIASMDDESRAHPNADFWKVDLTDYHNCLSVCRDMDYVFNLLCAKGSPEAVRNYPATLMRPIILFNTHLFDAAIQAKVGGFLYTSSIGVYYPAPFLKEEATEKTPPPPNDFAGRAKLIGEWYAAALRREHNCNITIARPANTYGPYDNFDPINANVVPSLIRRAVESSETHHPLTVGGDGSAIRDFIYVDDMARGLLLVAEKNPDQPINLGSGVGVSIRSLAETIVGCLRDKPEIIWDTSRFSGDSRRVLDISRAEALGFEPKIDLKEGIKKTMDWYKANRRAKDDRYDVLKQTE